MSNLSTRHLLHNGRKVSMTTEAGTRIDQKFEAGHFYEHKLLGHITGKSRAGVFLDVGGNCGQHAVYFALFCPSTLVYCVEPLPEHVELIRKNIADNALDDKIRLLPIASGDSVSSVRVTTNAVNFDRRFTAVSMPLDDVVTGPVSVIKIDVEGMEMGVLGGLKKTIKRDSPAIYIECLNNEAISQTSAFLYLFGYSINPEPFHETMYEFTMREE